MSDKLNKDEKDINFKDQILRDLEALKAKIKADDATREAEIAREEASIREAVEASLQRTLSSLDETETSGSEPAEIGSGREALADLTAQKEQGNEADLPEISEEETSFSGAAAEAEEPAERSAPDSEFVREQAKRFADMRAQIDAQLSRIDENHASGLKDTSAELPQTKVPLAEERAADLEAEAESVLFKVPVTFKPEQVNLDGFETKKLKFDFDDSETEVAANETDSTADVEADRNRLNTEELAGAPLRTEPDSDGDEDDKLVRSRRSQSQAEKRRNGAAKRIVLGIAAALIAVLLVTGIALGFYWSDSLKAVDSKSKTYVQVKIPEGVSAKEIGQILKKKDLIRDANVFNYYTKLNSYSDFQSGFHNLRKNMDVKTIIEELQKEGTPTAEDPSAGKITIPEGYTLKQIAEAATLNAATSSEKDKTPFTADDFMKTVQDEAFISEMAAKYPKLLGSLPAADSGVLYRLEGYLFPATYDYKEGTKVRDLIDQMLAATDSTLAPYYDQISSKGQTVHQVLTLASLVEKEGSTDEDRRNIASVFYNRLNAGMPLQSNIALLYADGKLGEKTSLKEDVTINTEMESPYNIYINTGYMPGPVDSPSLSALEATVNPSQTDYLYFVADVNSGLVYFANNYEEHAANVENYVNSNVAPTQ